MCVPLLFCKIDLFTTVTVFLPHLFGVCLLPYHNYLGLQPFVDFCNSDLFQTLLTPESACYKDDDGRTVLMLAAEIGSLPATRLILEIAGMNTVDDCDHQSRTALHLATIGGHGDVVNFLLEQQGKVVWS